MEIRIGQVIHYYNKIGVAVLAVRQELEIGDQVHFIGHTTDFVQEVNSLEIDHQKVEWAEAGSEVAVKVEGRVRKGDDVFKVIPT